MSFILIYAIQICDLVDLTLKFCRRKKTQSKSEGSKGE